jgi:nitrate reductase cytochrome c-type subunit
MKLSVLIALAAFAAATAVRAADAPPVPHPVDGYVVTRAENSCLECHDKPRDIGKKRSKGAPVPAPASHYADVKAAKPEISNANFTCTDCHKPK